MNCIVTESIKRPLMKAFARLTFIRLLIIFLCVQVVGSVYAQIVSPFHQEGRLALGAVTPLTAEAGQFDRVEFKVDFQGSWNNPFDSTEVTLDASITTPSGKTLSMPGFLYRPFERIEENGSETLKPAGAPEWRIRFCPTEAGAHVMTLKGKDRTGEVHGDAVKFNIKASSQPGFVRISARDRRYFAFDNGQSYFPVGANVCWSYAPGTRDYDAWFPAYAKSGCNYSRLWLSPHWTTFALERPGKPSDGLGMGQYDLGNAWRIDYVLDLAQQQGLYLMLCIDSYNILRKKDAYPQWDATPHNAVHGGPLKEPTEFWTSPIMDKLYLDKLRYLVARYGAAVNVLAWEFWNEVDITSNWPETESRAWHERMGRALRAMDPYKHLITSSFAHSPGFESLDRLPEIDYAQTHHYNSPDIVLTIEREQRRKAAYGKPHYIGEIGADAGGPRENDDPQGLQVHDTLWISVVTGGSGAAASWWWDNLIHPRNLYGHYAALNAYIKGIDWPAEGFATLDTRMESISGNMTTNTPPLLAWALSGKNTALAWVRLKDRSWRKVIMEKAVISPAEPSVLILPKLGQGKWNVELWNTWTGQILARSTIECSADQTGRVPLPAIEKDLAIKLTRVP